jgi:arabinose-5-phosphate isomerase
LSNPVLDPQQIIQIGQSLLETEGRAITQAKLCIDQTFVQMVEKIAKAPGRLVVTGMGKAGFIAQKISATFASTGTPSLFLHPADAVHGDLGRIGSGDIVLALSHSGETEEMIRLIAPLRRVGTSILAMTAHRESSLGSGADLCLAMGKLEEAGNGLAPTTSTAVMLSLGDALAMAVQECRGFTTDQFAQFHPGGSLGRKLMRVHEVMRKGEMLPMVSQAAPLSEVIAVMTQTRGRPGATTVVGPTGELVGMFTDGDLRRLLQSQSFDPNMLAGDAMGGQPKTVHPQQYVVEAAQLLGAHHVDQVAVVDETNKPVGLLDIQDLLSMKFL